MIIRRFSSIIKTRGIRLSLAKKQKLREDIKRVKEMSRAIKTQKQEDKEAKKQRRRENLKRAEENRKKSEVVQVVSTFPFLLLLFKTHICIHILVYFYNFFFITIFRLLIPQK